MNTPPCRDCPDRYIGCHGKCPAYLDWRKNRNAELAISRMDKETYVDDHEFRKRLLAQQRQKDNAKRPKKRMPKEVQE